MPKRDRATLSRDVLTRFADQACVSVGNFLVGVMVARFVGPLQFGAFALLWTVVLFTLNGTWAIVMAPMQTTLASFDREKLGHVLATLSWMTVGLAALGSLIGLAVAMRLSKFPLSVAAVFAFSGVVFFVVMQDFSRRWLLATEHSQLALGGDMIRHVSALAVLIYVGHGDLLVCLLILAGAAGAGCIPLIPQLRSVAHDPVVSHRNLWAHMRIGMWLVPSVAMQSVASAVPIYALGIESGVAAAGGYRAAFNLLSPIVSLTEALETFLPLRSRQAMLLGGTAALRALLWKWWWPLQILCFVFGAGIWADGPSILTLAFGPAYIEYAPLLAPLAVALNLQFASYMLHVALRGSDRTRFIPQADIAATVLLIVLFVCVPVQRDVQLAAAFIAVAQAVKVAIWGFHARDLAALGLP